jgi:hypothetical protein
MPVEISTTPGEISGAPEIIFTYKIEIRTMSRPRTPTAVLELRGSFKNHPERAKERAGEPRPTEPLGDPPKRLKRADKAAWREMQEHGFWLTSADQFLVEIAANLMAKHRGGTIDNPARSLLVGTLSKLGFGPGAIQDEGAAG